MAERQPGVRTKAAVVDAAGTVLWSTDAPDVGDSADAATAAKASESLEALFPMAAASGLREAIAAVSDSGQPRHLSTPLVSTARGRVAVTVSLYRLPDSSVLVMSDHTWEHGRGGGRR